MCAAVSLEWPATLDVAELLRDGWAPVPFREFIVKIHSRCDLACDYCYMYEMADQSWRDRPRRMSPEIAKLALILHGGEPLLAGRPLISCLVADVRDAAGPRVAVDVSVQTNAVGLDD